MYPVEVFFEPFFLECWSGEMWLSHFLTTHVFSGDEVETVEEMGWPMRVLTIELEDGQQWGRRTAEKLSIPVLCPCQECNCDLFEYVSLERLSIPVLVHINGSSNNTILAVHHGLNVVLISPERKSIHEFFCYFWKACLLAIVYIDVEIFDLMNLCLQLVTCYFFSCKKKLHK